MKKLLLNILYKAKNKLDEKLMSINFLSSDQFFRFYKNRGMRLKIEKLEDFKRCAGFTDLNKIDKFKFTVFVSLRKFVIKMILFLNGSKEVKLNFGSIINKKGKKINYGLYAKISASEKLLQKTKNSINKNIVSGKKIANS